MKNMENTPKKRDTRPLFKTNHSTIYTGNEENPVFNDMALVAANNIQPDKTGLKNIYKSLREDKFAKSLQKQMSYLGYIKRKNYE